MKDKIVTRFEEEDICKSKQDIYNMLTKITIPVNKHRRLIQREGHGRARSAIFGEIYTWGQSEYAEFDKKQRYETSTLSLRYPLHSKILMEFGKIMSGKKFRSVCVNDSYQMAKHVDSNNVGHSYIIGLGNYTGGELRVYESDDTYTDHDIRNGLFFNGSEKYHEVLPFFNDKRYSLVYFNY